MWTNWIENPLFVSHIWQTLFLPTHDRHQVGHCANPCYRHSPSPKMCTIILLTALSSDVLFWCFCRILQHYCNVCSNRQTLHTRNRIVIKTANNSVYELRVLLTATTFRYMLPSPTRRASFQDCCFPSLWFLFVAWLKDNRYCQVIFKKKLDFKRRVFNWINHLCWSDLQSRHQLHI